jgi:exodeoxyribonuclease VII small subunit
MTAGNNGAADERLASMTFEQIVEELEATIARMAGGNLGIEEVTDLYERAGQLHRLAEQRLAAIAARIAKLTASDG